MTRGGIPGERVVIVLMREEARTCPTSRHVDTVTDPREEMDDGVPRENQRRVVGVQRVYSSQATHRTHGTRRTHEPCVEMRGAVSVDSPIVCLVTHTCTCGRGRSLCGVREGLQDASKKSSQLYEEAPAAPARDRPDLELLGRWPLGRKLRASGSVL